MNMGAISIIDDVHDYDASNSYYTIYWNSGKRGKNKISINEYIQSNSIVIRDKYVTFINQFNESIVSGRTILEHLDVGEGYNLWWMSTLFEKSPFKTPGIYNCQKLLALELILSKLSYECVYLYSSDKQLIESIDMLCENLGVSFNCIQSVNKSHGKGKYYKWISKKVLKLLNSANRVSKILFSILAQVSFSSQYETTSNDRSLFVLSYLLNIDLIKLNEGKFYSNYWGKIQDLFDENGLNVNWVHTYLKSNSIDSYKEAACLVKKINRSSSLAAQHSILQSNLSFSGIIRSFSIYIKLLLKIPNNDKIKKLFYVSNSNVWFWPYLKKDWNNSVYGSTAMFNLLMISTFDSLLSKIPHQKNGLYLIENQGWERAFIHAWRRYNHGCLVGVHHTVLRFWDTRFFDVSIDTELAMQSLPQADLIAITGPHMRKLYDRSGYNHEKLVEVEALRYMHLNNLRSKRKSIRNKDIKNKNRFLILGSGNYEETQNILNVVSENKLLFDNQVSFIRHPISIDRYYFDEDVIKEINGDNFDVVINCDVAILPSATAASVDMYVIGLKVIIYDENYDFHLCPLFGIKSIYYASTSEELSALIKSALTDNSGGNFFWDNLSLPRWSRLLNKMGYNVVL
jgi:surface carbohydrate biosynthesis protein (TIGR04326 family)